MEKIVNNCDDCPFEFSDELGRYCNVTGFSNTFYDKTPFMEQCPLKNCDGIFVKLNKANVSKEDLIPSDQGNGKKILKALEELRATFTEEELKELREQLPIVL